MGEPKAVKPRRLPLRWRKVRYKVFRWSLVRYELWRGGEKRVTVERQGRIYDSWYWHGLNGQNTAHNPTPLEECKAEARVAALKWEAEHG